MEWGRGSSVGKREERGRGRRAELCERVATSSDLGVVGTVPTNITLLTGPYVEDRGVER